MPNGLQLLDLQKDVGLESCLMTKLQRPLTQMVRAGQQQKGKRSKASKVNRCGIFSASVCDVLPHQGDCTKLRRQREILRGSQEKLILAYRLCRAEIFAVGAAMADDVRLSAKEYLLEGTGVVLLQVYVDTWVCLLKRP